MKKTVFVAGAIALASCSVVKPIPETSVSAEGFQSFASARSFDPPGRIYRVAPNGEVYGVVTLPLTPKRGKEVIPKMVEKRELTLGQILNTVGADAVRLPAKLEAALISKHEVTMESVNGEREYVDDAEVDKAAGDAMRGITIRPNDKYYVIRETIRTDNAIFSSSKSNLVSLGVEAEFKNVVSTKSTLKWDDSASYSISKKFDEPLRLWYKAERLAVKPALGSAPGQPPTVTRTGVARTGELRILRTPTLSP